MNHTVEPFRTIWQAAPIKNISEPNVSQAPAITPARPSHAIPIRAPALFQIPPTPAAGAANQDSSTMHDPPRAPSPSLLPAAFIVHSRSSSADMSIRTPSPVSSEFSDTESYQNHSRANSTGLPNPPSRASHRGPGSTSSIASSTSNADSGHTHLLTPASRPGSTDPFLIPALPDRDGKGYTPTPTFHRGRTPSPNTPHHSITPSTITSATPTVTPYDGGNVTVLGGGVKLGGSSRPSSVMSTSRSPLDRSRSPSISLASRALNTALSPKNAGSTPTSPRKPRTRRRIMPTYLGHLGQPGVGGPIMGVFSQFVGKAQPGTYGPSQGQGWGHGQPGVGMGMAPPQMVGMGMRPMVGRIG